MPWQHFVCVWDCDARESGVVEVGARRIRHHFAAEEPVMIERKNTPERFRVALRGRSYVRKQSDTGKPRATCFEKVPAVEFLLIRHLDLLPHCWERGRPRPQ